MQIYE